MSKLEEFEKDLADVINKHSLDNFVGMPDFVLATYVTTTLAALKRAKEESALNTPAEQG